MGGYLPSQVWTGGYLPSQAGGYLPSQVQMGGVPTFPGLEGHLHSKVGGGTYARWGYLPYQGRYPPPRVGIPPPTEGRYTSPTYSRRHTARHVASTCYAVPMRGGGVPHPLLDRVFHPWPGNFMETVDTVHWMQSNKHSTVSIVSKILLFTVSKNVNILICALDTVK